MKKNDLSEEAKLGDRSAKAQTDRGREVTSSPPLGFRTVGGKKCMSV